MYDVNFTEEFVTHVNQIVDALNGLEIDEYDEMIEVLDKRVGTHDQESLTHLGVKAMIKMASMYRDPEKAKCAYEAFEAIMKKTD